MGFGSIYSPLFLLKRLRYFLRLHSCDLDRTLFPLAAIRFPSPLKALFPIPSALPFDTPVPVPLSVIIDLHTVLVDGNNEDGMHICNMFRSWCCRLSLSFEFPTATGFLISDKKATIHHPGKFLWKICLTYSC